jgi:hypothetical protein
MSSPPDVFETSSTYVGAIARALSKLGQLDAVIAKAEAPSAQMLRAPNERRWWGAAEVFGMTRALAEVGGDALVQQVGRLAVLESISVVLRPLVGVLMTLSGPSPATLFSRFGQMSETAVKNVKFAWTSTGPNGGELVITYPVPVPAPYVLYWLGAFDFVWETTKKKGTTGAKHEGATLRFTVSWPS